MISAVVATSDNGVIGSGGTIPWHMPADLAHFKELTDGNPIIMGRRTYESIGRALPNRKNIIITHDRGYKAQGCTVVGSIEDAIAAAAPAKDISIIGGQAIYEQSLPLIDRIYLTKIHAEIAGDRYFHYEPGQWQETSKTEHQPDEENKYAYDFIVLDRRR